MSESRIHLYGNSKWLEYWAIFALVFITLRLRQVLRCHLNFNAYIARLWHTQFISSCFLTEVVGQRERRGIAERTAPLVHVLVRLCALPLSVKMQDADNHSSSRPERKEQSSGQCHSFMSDIKVRLYFLAYDFSGLTVRYHEHFMHKL